MKFGLLGPLVVEHDGSAVPIGAAKERALLAALLFEAGSVVSTSRLIGLIWGENPPASVDASLLNHVKRLRGRLGDEGGTRIRTVAPGYLIEIGPGELDLDEFASRCADGRAALQAAQWERAATQLAGALALWRGEPAGNVPGNADRPAVRQLLEARLQALDGRIEAELALGRHRELLDELRALTEQYPVREDFHRHLMLALYRSELPDEALAVFETLSRTLDDHLGVEPSASVRQMRRRIAAADPKLLAPASAPADNGNPRFQLPADTRVFTGREQELDRLTALVGQAPAGNDAGMVVISAIDGMGGIGKTTLAVHCAHRVRDQFPDGQLFIDLQGYATDREPLSAGDGLDFFLRAMGVPAQAIPQDLGRRSAFYRDRLAGTRTLIILDNAASAAQVRPLLPHTPGSLVLVTSRRRLAGLDDADFLTLDVLPPADAAVLLHRAAGPGRIPEHHPAVPELLALCGHLPLAVQIVGARLRHHPDLRIEQVIGQLRDEAVRLGQLVDEDRSLTAVFDSSYAALPEPERRAMLLLGLVPGQDFEVFAAANLLGTDPRAAEHLLESLIDQNLLVQYGAGRYRMHDLVRAYCRNLSTGARGEAEAAMDRLLDYYQYTAAVAGKYLDRHGRPGPMPAAPGGAVPALPDRPRALAWLRAEKSNLVAAFRPGKVAPRRLIALAGAMAPFFGLDDSWSQAADVYQAAADAARDLGLRLEEANALWDLGRIRHGAGDMASTAALYEQALAAYRDVGDRRGEANILFFSARADLDRGQRASAEAFGRQALALYQDLGDRRGEAKCLVELAGTRLVAGDKDAARELDERALAFFQETGDQVGEASVLVKIAQLALQQEGPGAAARYCERSLALAQGVDNPLTEGRTRWILGTAYRMAGDLTAAAAQQEQARAMFRGLGSRTGEGYALLETGRTKYEAGEFAEADQALELSLAVFLKNGNRLTEANIRRDLGRVRHAVGDWSGAQDQLAQSVALFREIGDPQGEAEALNSTAGLLADTAGPAQGLELYRSTLQLARRLDSRLDEAAALAGAADCLGRLGDRAAARSDLREAVAIYRQVGADGLAATAERVLAGLE